MFRTESDAPSVYYITSNTSKAGIGMKLSGSDQDPITAYDNKYTNSIAANTLYMLRESSYPLIPKAYVFTGDGETIRLYVDGKLVGSQVASGLTESTYIGLGDNNTSVTYNAIDIRINEFKIYDYVLSDEEIQQFVAPYRPTTSVVLSHEQHTFTDTTPLQLTATILPEDTTDIVLWSSSDESVAVVSNTGEVTPKSEGSCTITITSGSCNAVCAIVVAYNKIELTAPAVVDFDLVNITDGAITNLGSGGAAYNSTIQYVTSNDSYEVKEDGLHLKKHAYATTPYAIDASSPFTVSVTGKYADIGTQTYARLMRAESDAPSAYYSNSKKCGSFKLAGVKSAGAKVLDSSVITWATTTTNGCYLVEDNYPSTKSHTYTWTNDGSIIKFYVDGCLAGQQNAASLGASTYVGLGDTDETKTYYASEIAISKFQIYDYCLNDEEVRSIAN